jgi:ABC-type spermidine/putrescine transport system permease subunit II
MTEAPVLTTTTTVPDLEVSPPTRRRWVDLLSLGLGVWAVIVYAFLFLPIVFVVAHSFNSGRAFLVWESFSTEPYSALWRNEALKTALMNSFKIAVGSTIIATVIGGFAGVALARRGGAWSKPFLLIVFLILVTPEIVDAIGYLIWFVRLDGPLNPQNEWLVPAGLLRLWIGHSVFSSAVVTLIVRARLAGLDESLEEAAADLGATPARAFRQITLPLMAPGLLAGALLAFTFSLDNTIVSAFVSVAGSTPFPVYVFGSVRAVLRPDIGAAATLMLALTLVALGIVALVLRRSGDSSSDVAATLTGG